MNVYITSHIDHAIPSFYFIARLQSSSNLFSPGFKTKLNLAIPFHNCTPRRTSSYPAAARHLIARRLGFFNHESLHFDTPWFRWVLPFSCLRPDPLLILLSSTSPRPWKDCHRSSQPWSLPASSSKPTAHLRAHGLQSCWLPSSSTNFQCLLHRS